MPKNEEVEMVISATRIIKREQTLDVDMLSPGTPGSPIYISSSGTASDVEVDAQMEEEVPEGEVEHEAGSGADAQDEEQDEKESRTEKEGGNAEDSDALDYIDPVQVSSGPLPQNEESEGEVSRGLSEEPMKDDKEFSKEPSKEPSREPSRQLSKEALRELSEQHADQPLEETDKDASKELSPAPLAKKEGKETTTRDSGKPSSNSEPTPAPATPPAVLRIPSPPCSDSDSDIHLDPRIQAIIERVKPAKLQAKAKEREQEKKGNKEAEAPRTPLATQPPPQPRKRPLVATASPFPLTQPAKPNKTPTVRRKEFLRYSATQPPPFATAPIAALNSQLSPHLSSRQRAQTISDDEDNEDNEPSKKRQKFRASQSLHSPAKTPRRPSQSQRRSAAALEHSRHRPNMSEHHWHTDGSVVLQFHRLGFKVHRSRLSQQSAFLARLFHDAGDDDITNDAYTERGGESTVMAWRKDKMEETPMYYIDGVAPQDFEKLVNTLDNAM